MASVLNKTTFQYLKSVNTPDYPEVAWWINPDVERDALVAANVPTKYWKANAGDTSVEEMTQAEKDTVDVADFPTNQLTKLGQMSAEVTAFIYERYDEATQSSLGKFLTTAGNAGLTNRVAHISAAINWVETLLTYFYVRKAAILAAADQAALDAESWDFSTYDAAADPTTMNPDPEVTIESALAIAD